MINKTAEKKIFCSRTETSISLVDPLEKKVFRNLRLISYRHFERIYLTVEKLNRYLFIVTSMIHGSLFIIVVCLQHIALPPNS